MIKIIYNKNNGKILAINRVGHGYLKTTKDNYESIELPDQDIDKHYEETENGEQLKKIYYPDDIQTWTLEQTKARKLEEIRSKANEIITAKWPLWKQQNANAGIYPQATKDQKDQDIADVIQASNDAEDKVDNAATIDEVEAVKPSWPTI